MGDGRDYLGGDWVVYDFRGDGVDGRGDMRWCSGRCGDVLYGRD